MENLATILDLFQKKNANDSKTTCKVEFIQPCVGFILCQVCL